MPLVRLQQWPAMVARWPLDPQKPDIIFIHGASHSASFWVEQIKALAPVANPVAIDLPGHGIRQDEGFDAIEAYAECLLDFMQANEIKQPIICGLSMGGAIVQDLLVNHGDKFAAGILSNTGARLKVAQEIFKAIESNYNEFVQMIYNFGTAPENRNQVLYQRLAAVSRCRPEIATGDFRACDNFDLMDKISTIEKPVLVITADKDRLTPVKYGKFLSDQIPNSRLENISGAGHFAPLEKPAEVNRLIEHFIKNLQN